MRISLETVTDFRSLPQVEEINILSQACEGIGALLPLLARLSDPHAYLIKMRLGNLPEQLTRLEIELQVLKQTCVRSKHPTRGLLEQQGKVRRKGQEILRHLAEVQAALQRDRLERTTLLL